MSILLRALGIGHWDGVAQSKQALYKRFSDCWARVADERMLGGERNFDRLRERKPTVCSHS